MRDRERVREIEWERDREREREREIDRMRKREREMRERKVESKTIWYLICKYVEINHIKATHAIYQFKQVYSSVDRI